MPTLDPSSDSYILSDNETTESEMIDDTDEPARPHDVPHDGYPTSHVEYAEPPQIERPVSPAPPKPMLVNATIYLSDAAAAKDVRSAFLATIAQFDIDVEIANLPIDGSWFQRFVLRVRNAAKEPAVAERLVKLERALEIQVLDRPQSQVNAADGGTVASLITALDNTDNAMITIGSILLVKANGLVAVRNLSVAEMKAVEHNPAWTMNPGAAMRYLQLLQDHDRAAELAAEQVPALQDNQAQL